MAGKHTQKKKITPESGGKTERAPRYGGQIYVDPAAAEKIPSRRRPETSNRYDYERSRAGGGPVKPAKKNHMKWAVPVLVVLLVGLIALGVLMFQTMKVSGIDTSYTNSTVNGSDIGGLTVEEAEKKLEAEGANVYKDKSVKVLLPMDRSIRVTAAELALGGSTSVPA